MANWMIGALFCTLSSLSLVTSTTGSSDSPFIVAHKKASLTRLKSGAERVSISIDVYNQGTATAYDVTLNDGSWAQTQNIFSVVTGNTSVSWDRLDVGAHLSHSFELEANQKTVFYGAPAVITFRIHTKAALQKAYSTPFLPLDVLGDRLPEKKFDWAKKLLGKYGSLFSVTTAVGLFVYMVATPSKSGVTKGSNKKRR